MARPTKIQTERRDKMKAAQHEAGHLTVCVASGVRGAVRLFRNEVADVDLEKTWLGSHDAYGPVSAAIAVAGVVAESWVDDQDVTPVSLTQEIEDEIIEPSPTDWKHIRRDGRAIHAAVVEALTALEKHKSFFKWAVAKLIKDEVVTEGMAAEKFCE